jgi:hypothetical protein
MGLLDRFKKNKLVEKATDAVGDVADKAGGFAHKVGDAVAEGVDKTTDFIDDKTGGKLTGALDKVDNMADKLRDNDEEEEEEEEEEEAGEGDSSKEE